MYGGMIKGTGFSGLNLKELKEHHSMEMATKKVKNNLKIGETIQPN